MVAPPCDHPTTPMRSARTNGCACRYCSAAYASRGRSANMIRRSGRPVQVSPKEREPALSTISTT
jgi:hypothetical protein